MIQRMFLSMTLLCLCMLMINTTIAQDRIILKEEKVADFYPKSLTKFRAKSYLFKVGEDTEYQVIGKKGENLETILMQDEEAYKQFKRFKRKMATGKIIFWTSTGTYLTTWGVPYNSDNAEAFRQDYQIRALIRLGTIIVGGTTTILLRNQAMRNLEKAIAIYNVNLESA